MPVMADHSTRGVISHRCELDSKGCVSLKSILDAFNTPLSEEQAWAVCYQTVKCILKELNSKSADGQLLYEVEDPSHIRIHKDGIVYPCSLRTSADGGGVGGPRKLAMQEYKMIRSLGAVIFRAMDYGLQEDDEPTMSQALDNLIDGMTSAGPNDQFSRVSRGPISRRNAKKRHGGSRESDGRERRRRRRTSGGVADDSSSEEESDEEDVLEDDEDEAFHDGDHPDDEGIERDHEERDDDRDIDPKKGISHGVVRAKRGLSFEKVLEICASHIPSATQPDAHYKAVCRALVAEVLELSSFLQKIAIGTKELRKTDSVVAETDNRLDQLRIRDWARLWVQVIHELRQGVKLKKVNLHDHLPHPYEFELTPYEMLLDDIRSRRYTLKKIMVNGDLPPRVKKDAHALILEFIRSRPPLVPVSKRVLPPPPVRQPSLYDKLMTSIRQQHKLKPTPPVESSRPLDLEVEKKCEPQQPRRRLIKPDLALRLSDTFDDDDDDYDNLTPTSDEPMSLPNFSTSRRVSPGNQFQESPASLGHERRLSISSLGTPDNKSVSSSRKSGSSQHSPSTLYSENYWSCSHWRSLECLSLTLEEVVHIRNVLTKAELESVVGNRSLYEDLEKGKICFTCKKIRFSLFGSWGHKCKLCERAVCIKCVTKMKVPTEHFAKIPVYMLSPTPSPPFEKEPSSLPFWKFTDNVDYSDSLELNEEDTEKKGSKSPSLTSTDDIPSTIDEIETPKENGVTLPATQTKHNWKLKHAESFSIADTANKFRKKTPLMRSKTIQVKSSSPRSSPRSPVYDILDAVNGGQKFTGPLVSVCRDCKSLVQHIMETSRNPPKEANKNNTKGTVSCAPFCLASVTESPVSPEQSPVSTNSLPYMS